MPSGIWMAILVVGELPQPCGTLTVAMTDAPASGVGVLMPTCACAAAAPPKVSAIAPNVAAPTFSIERARVRVFISVMIYVPFTRAPAFD